MASRASFKVTRFKSMVTVPLSSGSMTILSSLSFEKARRTSWMFESLAKIEKSLSGTFFASSICGTINSFNFSSGGSWGLAVSTSCEGNLTRSFVGGVDTAYQPRQSKKYQKEDFHSHPVSPFFLRRLAGLKLNALHDVFIWSRPSKFRKVDLRGLRQESDRILLMALCVHHSPTFALILSH